LLVMSPQTPGGNRKPLRLWPGVVAVILEWVLWFGVPTIAPDLMLYSMLGGVVCALAVLIWWLFFSRALWLERIGAIVLLILAVMAGSRIIDRSISNAMMGYMYTMLNVPVVSLALVGWAVATHRMRDTGRRTGLAVTMLLVCGLWAALRTNGITGEGKSQLAWRWTKTSEQKLLAETSAVPAAVPAAPAIPAAVMAKPVVTAAAAPATAMPVTHAVATVPEWPGFRGPHRDGVVRGVRIKTDWTAAPPVKIWRREVGPGWSSFAVGGGRIYTQEQRGDSEVVACYKLASGEPVWLHRDAARFWESNAGAGPRATPTLNEGRVYTFGATGILNALNAEDGSVVWTRNAAADTHTETPGWGFSSSPLVVGDEVIVATAGRLAGYDRGTGAQRWEGPVHGDGYSSPQLMTIGGVPQIVMMSGAGATGVAPDGKVLWEHAWAGFPIIQPAITGDGGLLIVTASAAGGTGTRRLAVAQGAGGWTAKESWTSPGLKPYFNDLVVHKGHAYGFDSSILACIDLQDGQRKWKGGRYGHGQMLLLADQDVLLVLSEEGDLALVRAVPDQFTELARVPAIEGKTWNHPVLVGDTLLVRNGQEMAAFRLARAE
jgi:outer membrane protein assembly factor BamB